MIGRRTAWSLLITLVVVGAYITSPVTSGPDTEVAAAPIKIDMNALRTMLTKGLKVSRPNQTAFVEKVLAMVSSNRLPLSLVYSSYRYAKRRNPSYPFPFFETSLRTLAKRRKILL